LKLVSTYSAIGLARASLNTAMRLPVEMKINLHEENRDMASPDTIDIFEALKQATKRCATVSGNCHLPSRWVLPQTDEQIVKDQAVDH